MIITSKNPKHRELGRDIEMVTRRMAVLSHFIQSQRKMTGVLAAFLEDLEESPAIGDVVADTNTMTATLNAVRESIAQAQELFEQYRMYFEKLDAELQKITRKAVQKDMSKAKAIEVSGNLSDLFPPAGPVAKSDG